MHAHCGLYDGAGGCSEAVNASDHGVLFQARHWLDQLGVRKDEGRRGERWSGQQPERKKKGTVKLYYGW